MTAGGSDPRQVDHPPLEPSPSRPFDIGFVSLLGLGVLVRLWAFVLRGALWNDEAGLALNIVGRAWSQVGRPYVYQQYAPYLFVLASKLVSVLLGASARTLRLLPLGCGIALVPAMMLFVRRIAGWPAALFALALLVPNTALVHYATEFKPYASDALIATALGLLTLRVLGSEPSQRPRPLFTLACAGALASWFSLPSIFVLAACCAALCVEAWERELGLPLLLSAAGLGGLWLTTFAMHYLAFMQVQPGDDYLQHYWAGMDAFAPFPPRSLADVRWYVAKFLYLLEVLVAPGSFGLRYLAAGLWCWGLGSLYRARRPLFVLLCTPVVLLFLASSAHKYIVSDRLMLFLVPMMITPVVIALAELAELTPVRGQRLQLLAAGIAVAFCAEPSLRLARSLAQGAAGPGIDGIVDHLEQNYRPGDRLYVETQAQWIYMLYARLAGFDAPFPVPDDGLYDDKPRYATLDTLRGAPRVWVIVPALGHNHPDSAKAALWIEKIEHLVTARLSRYGHAIDTLDGDDTRLYLFDLSGQ